MTSRSGPSSLSLLEDDNLLHEILLRLPSQPPYLMRASLVCKRWRRITTDSYFLRCFRLHHRRPPLLGVFSQPGLRISFTSTPDSPCRIPPERFSLWLDEWPNSNLVECRNGRVLINRKDHHVIVWDPITDHRRLLAIPPEFYTVHTAAVHCAANDQGHVHGTCHSSPFKVVLLGTHLDLEHGNQAFASVYSSHTGLWGDLISAVLPDRYRGLCISGRSTLVGSTLYWLNSSVILAFDTDNQRLTAVETPFRVKRSDSVQIIRAEDGGLGLAAFRGADYEERDLEIWERNVDPYDGVATWVFKKSVILQKTLGNYSVRMPVILNYIEDAHAIILRANTYVFMVQLDSMQPKELLRSKTNHMGPYYPFTSFCMKES